MWAWLSKGEADKTELAGWDLGKMIREVLHTSPETRLAFSPEDYDILFKHYEVNLKRKKEIHTLMNHSQ